MATRISDPEQQQEQAKLHKGSGGKNFKDMFLNLKPDEVTNKIVKNIRLVGQAIIYSEHSQWVYNAENVQEKREFPDHEENKSFSRICSENDAKIGACVWCELGFRKTTKYAWVCLERLPDGTSIPKILNKGALVFDPIFAVERSNKGFNADNNNDELCVALGSDVAHNIKITVEKVSVKEATGGMKYTIAPNPARSRLTPEEIELLRQSYEPNATDKAALLAEDPGLADLPDWYTFGFPLHKIFRYKGLAAASTQEATTPANHLDASGADEEEAVALPPAAATKPVVTAKAAATKAANAPAANPYVEAAIAATAEPATPAETVAAIPELTEAFKW